MRFLSLFSGIGGLDLGLERAGMTCVGQVEIDQFCREVLGKHWPGVKRMEDVREVKGDEFGPIDCIAGGFPCQDVSRAGQQAGIKEGTRSGLWSEYCRLIRVVRPKFVLVENVPGLLDGGIGRVLGDLAESGYDAEWKSIPASYVGAWHRRDRIWILAYPACDSQRIAKEQILWQQYLSKQSGRGFEKWRGRSNLPESRFCRRTNGIPNWLDRSKALGNAVVPQVAEVIGRAIMESDK